VRLRLSTVARRAHLRSWVGAEAGLGWTWLTGPVSSWVSGDVHIGSGDGARSAVSASIGGNLGMLTLDLRSTWISRLETGTSPIDSLRTATGWFQDPRGRYSDAQLTAQRALGPLTLTGVAGVRFGEGAREDRWAHTGVSLPLSRQTVVFAEGGVRPDRPEQGELGGSFLMLGLRLRPTAPERVPRLPGPTPPIAPLEVEHVGDGWAFTIRLPDARTVELSGDLTGWMSMRMTRTPDDPALWQLEVDAPAGVYLVALRIDGGAWGAPPGIPAVPDGYGGKAGLLELRPSN
jgi:hypothetical protein